MIFTITLLYYSLDLEIIFFVCTNILGFLIALKFKWQPEHEELSNCHK
jgi:hypothetical protein